MKELPEDIRAHRDWLLSFIPISKNASIVDLGCGTGEDLVALANKHPGVTFTMLGLDSSTNSIDAAAERSRAEPRIVFRHQQLGDTILLPDESCDVVYSSNLLECLSNRVAFLRDVVRILRPNGTVVMGHWDWDSQTFDASDKALVRRLVMAFADWKQPWMEHSDGWTGRRLWGLFRSTGFFHGTIAARTLINTEFDTPWYGHARAEDFRSLAKAHLVPESDIERFMAEQRHLSAAGRYFYSITGYVYVGRRAV